MRTAGKSVGINDLAALARGGDFSASSDEHVEDLDVAVQHRGHDDRRLGLEDIRVRKKGPPDR